MSRTPLDDLKAAHAFLSDEQLVAFFRTTARDPQPPLAVKIINQHLDRGEGLAPFFLQYGGQRGPNRPLVVELKVKRLGAHTLIVRFGLVGASSGDGGEWRVTCADNGALQRVEGMTFWTH